MPFAFCSARCGQLGCRLRAALRYGGTGARWGASVATLTVSTLRSPLIGVVGRAGGLRPAPAEGPLYFRALPHRAAYAA